MRWRRAEHWRKRAEEVRTIADGMLDPRNRATLALIAAEYDDLAALCRQVEHGSLKAVWRDRGTG